MKAKSTTWYFYFLVSQYNVSRWIEHSESSKTFRILKHLMEKKDMSYKCVVPIGIHIMYSFLKNSCGIGYHHWNKIFAIRKLTIHLVLQEFINVVNVVFKHHIKWPKGDYLVEVMGFLVCHLSMAWLMSFESISKYQKVILW
jgi:hypothetical protein